MIADRGQARDEMRGLFWAAWKAMDFASLGLAAVPLVDWVDVDTAFTPNPERAFARVTIKHTNQSQVAFRGAYGRPQRYTAVGTITIQVFTPISRRIGSELDEKLAKIAENALRGRVSPNGVWFPSVVAKEIGNDGAGFNQTNVLASFSYDTVQ